MCNITRSPLGICIEKNSYISYYYIHSMKQKVLFISGIILALIGAALMMHGSLFGERTIPAAITIGIVGIGLIATSKFRLLK